MLQPTRLMVEKRTVAICAALMAWGCLVQVLLVWRATVPSLDCVRFVHLAQSIDEYGLAALGEYQERPVFPLWLWAVHRTTVALAGPFRAEWAFSAQLAAAIAMVVVVVPVYFLSVRLVGRTAGLAAAVLFCSVREVGRLGADGISDSTHLVLLATALWALVEYWSRREASPSGRLGRAVALLAAGVVSALAALARLEAVTIPAAFLVAMLALQCQPARRLPWRQMIGELGCFALGFAMVSATYMVAIQTTSCDVATLSNQPTNEESDASAWRLPDGEFMSFAVKEPTQTLRRRGYLAATGQFFTELGSAFGLWGGALAAFGLWRLHGRQASQADRFLQVFLVVFSLAALQYSANEGYLTSRHLLVWVVVGASCAGLGAVEAGRLLAELPFLRNAGWTSRLAAPAVVATSVIACAFSWVEPLHASRLGHRLAAEWLAREADLSSAVFDTQGWTGLYSGHPTYLADESQRAWSDRRLRYVVIEERELGFDSNRSRTLRWLLETAGQPVAAFRGVPTGGGAATVLVYRWYPERLPIAMIAHWTSR